MWIVLSSVGSVSTVELVSRECWQLGAPLRTGEDRDIVSRFLSPYSGGQSDDAWTWAGQHAALSAETGKCLPQPTTTTCFADSLISTELRNV